MQLECLPQYFSVCQVKDFACLHSLKGVFFAAGTGQEYSLVCETAFVPGNVLKRQDDWRAFRIAGQLDFSLVGVLAELALLLKNAGVSIFAVSTFDTDYLLVRSFQLNKAESALLAAGHSFLYL